MNRLVLTVLVTLFSVSLSFCLSASISDIHVILDLSDTNSVTETIVVNATNPYNDSTSVIYVLMYDTPYKLEISDGVNKLLNFTVFLANDIYTIQIFYNIPPNSNKELYLKFFNTKALTKFEDYYFMSYSFKSYYNTDNFYLEVKLPSGYGITKKSGNPISPPPSALYSDGQHILVKWSDSIRYGENNAYTLFFEKLSNPVLPLESFALVGFISFVSGFILSKLISRKKSKEIIAMALTNDEKKIVDLITSNKNAYQNDLEKALDFSKPKLSKIIHSLENKGILFILPSGRKNKIELNKKLI